MSKKLDEFDKIVAELLREKAFRDEVCPNPGASEADKFAAAEVAIGTHRWRKIKKIEEKRAIITIACTPDNQLTTEKLDDALKNAGKSAAFYFTDW